MPLAAVTDILSAPGLGGAAKAQSFALGTLTTNTSTDHVDTLGYTERIYVQANNGITNAVTWEIQTSTDGTNWAAISGTSGSHSASTVRVVHATPATQVARYVRVTVSSANAVGTAFTLYMERP